MPSSPTTPPPAGTRDSGAPLPETVASTKLQPPRSARRLLPREALLARLQEARRQRCVIVQGPAGSGKTSTLVAWRQALLALDFDVAWLSLAAEDDDVTRFFACLLASLSTVDSALVQETAQLMGRDSDETVTEHWVITLVQAIAARPRELVLVIDDLQQVADARVFQSLQWLLEYAPPNLHLVLGSRSAIPLSLGRLRQQGQVAEFDLRDLRFTPEESERFLHDQLGAISKRDAQVLHELTDGWVAGLQLFAVDLKAKQGTGFRRVQVRDAEAFASYFEREVLVRLAPEDLELLTRAAICNRFCASLCAALLDQPHAMARMTTRLAQLDGQNLFIAQVSALDREIWYRMHPLLREVLLARLAAWPEAKQRALHGTAWRWFEARGHVDEAVRHAVLAGESEAAAGLVESWASDLLARGELTQLGGLLHRLPPEQVHDRFVLRLAQAHLQLFARDLDQVEATLRELEPQASSLDARERYTLTLLRAGLALQRDDSDAVAAIRPALEAIPADAESFAFTGRNHTLAWMHMNRSQYEEARALLAESEHIGVGLSRRQVGRVLEGMSYSIEGRMLDADAVLRDVLSVVERNPVIDVGVGCVAAALLGDALYEANQLDAACEMIEPRIELLERASMPDAVMRGLLVLSLSHARAGRRLEALAWLERLEDYATRHGLDRPLAHALALRLRWLLKVGETAQAEATLKRVVALGQRHAGAGPGTTAEIVRNAGRAQADMSMHWNDFDAAATRLRALVADTQAARRWRSAASLHMQLASAEAGRGDAVASRKHLLEALRLGHRLGLLRSLLDSVPRVPVLLEPLLSDPALDPVLAFYVRRLLEASSVARRRSQPPAAPSAAIDAFSEREREVLHLVAQAMPNKKIARVLGVTPHTVKWHLRKIYSKLGVTERDEAVARMRDLETGESPKPR